MLIRFSTVIVGLAVTNDILQGKTDWSKLFEPLNFFEKYKYVWNLLAELKIIYLLVTIVSFSLNSKQKMAWLFQKLEVVIRILVRVSIKKMGKPCVMPLTLFF